MHGSYGTFTELKMAHHYLVIVLIEPTTNSDLNQTAKRHVSIEKCGCLVKMSVITKPKYPEKGLKHLPSSKLTYCCQPQTVSRLSSINSSWLEYPHFQQEIYPRNLT